MAKKKAIDSGQAEPEVAFVWDKDLRSATRFRFR
jgi:hypothetical protein